MKKQCFTIIELIVAMAVFGILMLALMQVFGGMQNIWSSANDRSETYRDAALVIDFMTNDFQKTFTPESGSNYFQYTSGTNSGALFLPVMEDGSALLVKYTWEKYKPEGCADSAMWKLYRDIIAQNADNYYTASFSGGISGVLVTDRIVRFDPDFFSFYALQDPSKQFSSTNRYTSVANPSAVPGLAVLNFTVADKEKWVKAYSNKSADSADFERVFSKRIFIGRQTPY